MTIKNTEASRVAVVTGGHRGIGLAITKTLSAAGIKVVVGARNATERASLDRVDEATEGTGIVLPLDVASLTSVNQFFIDAQDGAGNIDILVNNAGISVHSQVGEHADDDWEDVIATNLTGPFRTCRAVLPGMKKRGWGRIVNIASTAARAAVATSAAYSASKSGLLGLSRAVALEGAPFGVTCVTVSPTWIETDMLRESALLMGRREGIEQYEIIERIRCTNPQQRLVQPDEVASLVGFLASDAAPGLTMEDIQINAGAFW